MGPKAQGKTPAESLHGLALGNGWKVIDRIPRPADTTGGWFSCSYHVEDASGRRAFLKALDYSSALRGTDPAQQLAQMTNLFLFEREVLELCSGKNMDRVVRALDHGTVRIGGTQTEVVQYLIFEIADGDIRWKFEQGAGFETGWSLRTLHNVCTGLKQLHSAGIAHQDLKPSNVLVFEDEDCSKVGDLGSASRRGTECPRDDCDFAGDRTYAPPELLYGQLDPEWDRRRLACDAYLFGSLIVFFFSGCSMTSLIMKNLEDDHHYLVWGDGYEAVMPYVRNAFGDAVVQFAESLPLKLRDELTGMVRELCDPDPQLRGHPRSRAIGTPFSLERYVSRLDVLAKKARLAPYQ